MLGQPVEHDVNGLPMYQLQLHGTLVQGQTNHVVVMNDVKDPASEGMLTSVIPYQFWTAGTAHGRQEGWGVSPKKEYIVLKSFKNKWVSMNSPGGERMTADRGDIGPWEKIQPIYLGNKEWAFKAWNGKYLSASNGTMQANRDQI